jgi:GDP-L-fucose synthase
MIRKFHEAKVSGVNQVVLWGDGSPLREFLYSDDLADAVVYEQELLTGQQLPDAVCRITWDTAKPNGTPRKQCDISRLSALGFTAKTALRDGIKKAYMDFLSR